MCGGGGAPEPVKRDPVAEQLEAERKATEKANAEAAQRRTARRKSSLLATAGKQAGILPGTGSTLSSGKDTLGG